ncbi:DNA-directed RNA polymerase subunit alpha C-terminal domain-containing protein [Arthrobacter bambusae]|uniref:DNA-directed RNA polymerase subunit alpha C-terminal domain-containing protein n=1 Tax=Arthrobacter bambusae TaxID=1338426 RepID=UPI00278389FC|nr:DNA-directed RNA polymerase subunit alpha C-terminal domain-containing protein [Arthrobacter bambusae]MDQ0031077.1 hypothetical protein [Arthrobacter bambusae]MDQ0098790.1 hypothetical protein [Arthrobacter bambusae]
MAISTQPDNAELRSIELRSSRPIGQLGLTNRTANALQRQGVNTVAQRITRSPRELAMEIRGLGESGFMDIEEKLHRLGLGLAAKRTYSCTKPAYRSAINHNTWMKPVPEDEAAMHNETSPCIGGHIVGGEP